MKNEINDIFVYIASPYTFGDQFINTQVQIDAANNLYDKNFIPISPLLNSVFCNMQKPRDWQFWMDICLTLLNRCDILLRLPGESKGADEEIEFAKKNNIPVIYGLDEFYKWVDEALVDEDEDD